MLLQVRGMGVRKLWEPLVLEFETRTIQNLGTLCVTLRASAPGPAAPGVPALLLLLLICPWSTVFPLRGLAFGIRMGTHEILCIKNQFSSLPLQRIYLCGLLQTPDHICMSNSRSLKMWKKEIPCGLRVSPLLEGPPEQAATCL